MNPTAHLLSLAKIIQELNHANGRSVDSLRLAARSNIAVKEHEVLQQRLHMIELLVRHQQELLHDFQPSVTSAEPIRPNKPSNHSSSLPQDWNQIWLQIIRHNAPPNTKDREMEQELQQLLLLALRLFHRLGLDPAQVLNDLSLKLAQQEPTVEHQVISPDRYCKP